MFYLPYNPALKERARSLRRNMTPAEQMLWKQYLRHFPYRVLRQRPIDNFIVDFYCAALRLVIEVDGKYHASAEAQARDGDRTRILESYGLRVIRFTNEQVFSDLEGICAVLMELAEDPPSYSR